MECQFFSSRMLWFRGRIFNKSNTRKNCKWKLVKLQFIFQGFVLSPFTFKIASQKLVDWSCSNGNYLQLQSIHWTLPCVEKNLILISFLHHQYWHLPSWRILINLPAKLYSHHDKMNSQEILSGSFLSFSCNNLLN